MSKGKGESGTNRAGGEYVILFEKHPLPLPPPQKKKTKVEKSPS